MSTEFNRFFLLRSTTGDIGVPENVGGMNVICPNETGDIMFIRYKFKLSMGVKCCEYLQ